MKNGRVLGRLPGRTEVAVQIGGCIRTARLDVWRRVPATDYMRPHDEFASTNLDFAAGEMRSWRAPPGHYEMILRQRDTANSPLALGAAHANCARYHDREPQHYSCITDPQSAIVVVDRRAIGAKSPSDGTLLLRNLDDRYFANALPSTCDGPVGPFRKI